MKNYLLLSFAILLLGCQDQQNTTQTEPVENLNRKEALLIGTFHYNNPGADVAKTKSFDILNKQSQDELEMIATHIKNYNPTKIFVEWPYDKQRELDSLYRLYKEDSYFKNDSLSPFYLKNEIFQLAFRVAKKNNLEKVYGIDYKETNFPFNEVMRDIENSNQPELKAKIETIAQFTEDFDAKIDAGLSLTELTYYVNSPEMRNVSNTLHNNIMLLAGGPNDLSGPLLTSEWFKRNIYMWSFIQKIVAPSDERIMILAGSSHVAMFELFIDQNSDWTIKEFQDIMKK